MRSKIAVGGALCSAAIATAAAAGGNLNVALLRDPSFSQMRFAAAAASALAPSATAAVTQERPALRDKRSQAVFLRGGYSFASGGGAALADGKGAKLFAAGYRARIGESSPVSFEGEVIWQRDKDLVTIGVGQEQATRRAISGLMSLRYDAPKLGPVRPYVSGGVGPVHVKTEIDNGVSPLASSNIELAYGARAGVTFPIHRNWSLDAGYRLLGATNDDIKTHSGEIGLTYRF
jgi:opacity protein-like surface antigen